MEHYLLESNGSEFNFLSTEGLVVTELYDQPKTPIRWRMLVELHTKFFYVEPIFSADDSVAEFLSRAWKEKENSLFHGKPETLFIASSLKGYFEDQELLRFTEENEVVLIKAPGSFSKYSAFLSSWSRNALWFALDSEISVTKQDFRNFVLHMQNLIFYLKWDTEKKFSERMFTFQHKVYGVLRELEIYRNLRQIHFFNAHNYLEYRKMTIECEKVERYVYSLYEAQCRHLTIS